MSTTVATEPIVEMKQVSQGQDAIKSLISGGIGGMCLVLAGYPLDLLKVKAQTTHVGAGSIKEILMHIIRSDGIRGLYRGMSAPLVGIVPIFAVCFWGYDQGKALVRGIQGKGATEALSLGEIMVAGGLSALPTTVVLTPAERIKVMVQTQDPRSGKPTGTVAAIRSILGNGQHGLRGLSQLYRGTVATLARDVPGSMAYFGVYEGMKRGLSAWMYPAASEAPPLPILAILLAGGLGGMANWTVSIPADVIKSRIQAAPAGSSASGMQILKTLLKEEGPGALFQGLGPALLRAFPANAACFFGVEFSLKLLNQLW